jgi:tRNA(Ile)-lysidine synthase
VWRHHAIIEAVIPFIRNVRETISRHRMLTPQDRVLVGVSGGADSTALLLALQELGYSLAVAHLNHGLRGSESDEDERFVKELADRHEIPFFSRSVAVGQSQGNLEAAGREARREFFRQLLEDHGFTRVALAHNREDRVETFLMHLMRGAGTEGLVSMAPVSGETIRPLVETSRAEIEGFLAARGQSWREDATNLDMSFSRNRMRLDILPRLASLFNPQLVDALTRTITLLQEEDEWMSDLADAWLDSQPAQPTGLNVAALRQLPGALARRVIRQGLRRSGCDLTNVTFDHVEAVRSLLDDGKSGKTIQLPGGVGVLREFNQLTFSEAIGAALEFTYELPIPGTLRVPELGRVFRATCVPADSAPESLIAGPTRVLVDGGRLGPYVKIRSWKPGDYYKPAGWPSGKVKKLFQRARVPRSQRGRWPLFATDSTIIWVTSFPVSREFTPGECTKKIVAFEALEG